MTYKTSDCCDAYVNPDLMVCADCKEPCNIIIDDEEIYTNTEFVDRIHKNKLLPKRKITPHGLYKSISTKNPTKTFIGGLVVGIFIGLFISAVFIHLTLFS